MHFPLVVFDCDGVILESVEAKTKAFYRLGLNWGEEAAAALRDFHLSHLGVSRFLKFEWFFADVLKQPLSEAEAAKLGQQFADLCLTEVTSSELVPGCKDCLEYLHGRSTLWIASGMPDGELKTIIKARGLDMYFAGVLGSPPGKTDLLDTIIFEEGIPPEQTLMVGDSSTDLRAALAVGSSFFGRGAQFANSGYPWHEDLTGLLAYLKAKD